MASMGFVFCLTGLVCSAAGAQVRGADPVIDNAAFYKLKESVMSQQAFQLQVGARCEGQVEHESCVQRVQDGLFCHLLYRSHPAMAHAHCDAPGVPNGTPADTPAPTTVARALVAAGTNKSNGSNG